MSKDKQSTSLQNNNRRPMGPPGMGGGGAMGMEKAGDFKGTMKKLVSYLKKYMPVLIFCILLSITAAVLALFGPKILANATNLLVDGFLAMISGTGSIDFEGIFGILVFCGVIYVISAVLQYLQSYIFVSVSNRISYKMRREISEKINNLPLSYFDRVSQGDVLSRVTNDVDMVTQSLTQSLPQLLTSITTVLGVVIMMGTINIWMMLITLVILPVSMFLMTRIIKRSQVFYKKQQDYLGEANGQVEEMYGGHLVVRAFNHEEESKENFNEVNERLYGAAWKSQFLGGLMMPVMTFVGNIAYVAVVILGGYFTLTGVITVGDIQAFMQYVRSFTQPITQIANSANILQQTAAAAERVFEFLAEKDEEPDADFCVDTTDIKGDVTFAHVNFGYIPEKIIINDFSAMVKQGEKVAIVGPTGAGKTTMVKLLMRFYDVNSGAVLVDGYDVKQFKRDDFRDMFGMVLQDTWLYNDTIMENIRYGRLDATDEEVYEAAKAAQAHRFIRTLPDGYKTELNEEASNISQGQKQLLTIARTILSQPKMLILDEATSSVDTRTEILIQKGMAKLMEGRTSFVIAHRLSTIRDADMILAMKDGDVLETGSHDELMAKGGFYADLYNSQFEKKETA